MIHWKKSTSVIATLSLFCIVGCGGSSFPSGETGTLKGKVTYNGTPVPAGTVVTLTHIGTQNTASAVVGSDGAYQAAMRGQFKVLTGGYRVTVVSAPQSTEMSEAEMEAVYSGEKEYEAPVGIPAKYYDAQTSGLTAQVDAGDNNADFELTD